jgi:hypothetical protein
MTTGVIVACGISSILHINRHGVWVPAFAGTTMDFWPLRFSQYSSGPDQNLSASLDRHNREMSWNAATF